MDAKPVIACRGGRAPLVVGAGMLLAVLAVSCQYACATGKALKVERDWMSGYKPSCGRLGSALVQCDYYAVGVVDDDSNCPYFKYAVDCTPSLQSYVALWENDPKPADRHKVHILGADLWNSTGDYWGWAWQGSCCHSYAVVCVTQCGGSGTSGEMSTSNHEIGHEFGCDHCTNTACVMHENPPGPIYPYYFCTTGQNHAQVVKSTDP